MGSIVNITDASEVLKTTYTYSAFGEFATTYNDGTIDSPFTFTGREYSSSTGLYHYRARNYLPGIGQFISRDPYPYDIMTLNTIQRYNYCRNSPVNFVDPWGLMWLIGPTFMLPNGQLAGQFNEITSRENKRIYGCGNDQDEQWCTMMEAMGYSMSDYECQYGDSRTPGDAVWGVRGAFSIIQIIMIQD